MCNYQIRLSSSQDVSSISIFFTSAFISLNNVFHGQCFLLYSIFPFTLMPSSPHPHLEKKIKILWRSLSFHTSPPTAFSSVFKQHSFFQNTLIWQCFVFPRSDEFKLHLVLIKGRNELVNEYTLTPPLPRAADLLTSFLVCLPYFQWHILHTSASLGRPGNAVEQLALPFSGKRKYHWH